MTRDTAIRLVEKLEMLADPRRGGTEHEREVASRKATRLRSRFSLQSHEGRRRKPAKKRTFAGFSSGIPPWEFDFTTGMHSANVMVHRFNSKRDWHIEIDLEAESAERRGLQR